MIFRRIFQLLLLAGIELYRLVLRPFFPTVCRYYPSCSQYAKESLVKYGPLKGSWRALLRLLRCNPWHPGGVDLP